MVEARNPLVTMNIGTAGEHLVCADLLLRGYRAYMVAAGSTYDVVADIDGRLFRIAVKSTLCARERPKREGSRVCYQFAVTRARRLSSGKTDARRYSPEDVDIVALVAIDIKSICYVSMSICKSVMHIDTPAAERGKNKFGPKGLFRRKRFEDFTLEFAINPLAHL